MSPFQSCQTELSFKVSVDFPIRHFVFSAHALAIRPIRVMAYTEHLIRHKGTGDKSKISFVSLKACTNEGLMPWVDAIDVLE